jgi:hypothetical protein
MTRTPGPDFMIIGAMKAGTTTLYRDLEDQPGFFLPQIKEPAVLVRAASDAEARERYAYLYRSSPSGRPRGEASTHYTQRPRYEGIAERAWRLFGGDLRLVYLVRHPVERTLSHHGHLFAQGDAPARLQDALRTDPTLVAFSRYAMQLEPWLEAFGRDAILVIRFEDYVRDRMGVIQNVADHVGAAFDPGRHPRTEGHNRSEGKEVPPRLWRRLAGTWVWQRWLRPAIPARLRQRVKSQISTAAVQPPKPGAEILASLADELADDAARLARLLGSPSPLWDVRVIQQDG